MHTPGDWVYDPKTRMIHGPSDGSALRPIIAQVSNPSNGPVLALAPEMLQLLIDIRKPLADDNPIRDRINRIERRSFGMPV